MILNKEEHKLRIIGGGRNPTDLTLGEFLYSWRIEQRNKRFLVSYKRLIAFAKQRFKDCSLKFYRGLLSGFLKRNKLSYRKITANTFVDKYNIHNAINEWFPALYQYKSIIKKLYFLISIRHQSR